MINFKYLLVIFCLGIAFGTATFISYFKVTYYYGFASDGKVWNSKFTKSDNLISFSLIMGENSYFNSHVGICYNVNNNTYCHTFIVHYQNYDTEAVITLNYHKNSLIDAIIPERSFVRVIMLNALIIACFILFISLFVIIYQSLIN